MRKVVARRPPSSWVRVARLRKTFQTTAFLAITAALVVQTASQAQVSELLTHSRGFLLTGDYRVGGVDLLRTGGNGVISFSQAAGNQVPEDAEIKAAFLYWEEIEPVELAGPINVTFRGATVEVAKATRLTSLPGTGASCWGSFGGSNAFLTMYRADVLHLLPKRFDANDRWTGRYLVNDADLAAHNLPPHVVSIPQQGTGNRTRTGAGATLLIVYQSLSEPLRKILVYDGAAVQAQGTITSHILSGFYKASAQPSARLTYLAGSGADNTRERLLFNGTVVATNPFPRPIDQGSDRGWSNPTFDVSALMAQRQSHPEFGEVVTTTVDHGSGVQQSTPYECLSFGGIVFSTTLADIDADGLPDGQEEAINGLKDPPTPDFPTGLPLPNLHAMGAQVGPRDLFVEINAMQAPAGTVYGSSDAPISATQDSVADPDGHDHMPSPAALKMVADALIAGGITPHFDVGDVSAYAAQYPCLNSDPACDVTASLVPTAHARGGERIQERACADCQFKDYPGTLGWPFGFQLTRDAPVGALGEELITFQDIENASLENGQLRRRFDRNRHPYVHYTVFGHARGKARSSLPCLDGNGNETGYDGASPATCAVEPNPAFHVPAGVSGAAELPGGNIFVTLGFADTTEFVGTPFVQASTFLHELGHNLNLWHGGLAASFGDNALNTATFVEPNCKPNYLSVMSYLFQLHGLFDNAGNVRVDFSGSSHDLLNESALSDGPLSPAAAYRPAWFVPANSPLAVAQGATAARRFCNGATFPSIDPMMARVQAAGTTQSLDWDGNTATAGAGADVNFDGGLNAALQGHNDWASVRLDQIQAGRTARIFSSASGDFLDFGSGDLLDFGSGDLLDFGSGDLLDFGSGTHIVHLGSGDFFRYGAGDLLDFGTGDLLDFGSGDLLDFGSGSSMFVGAPGDLLDFGTGDLLDFGSGDLLDFGTGDLLDFGSGDLLDFGTGDLLDFGSGDLLDFGSGTGLVEVDFTTAFDMARPRPHGLAACILGVNCPAPQPAPSTPTFHRIALSWNQPTFGTVVQYEVYRSTGTTPPLLIGTTSNRTFVDTEELPNGVSFTYFVKARFDEGSLSPNSDSVVVQAVNEPPVAVNDPYNTRNNTAVTVPAPGVLANDTDVDSPAASRRVISVVTQPANGTLAMNANGSFTYTPRPGFQGVDTFTYVADNGPWSRDPTIPLSGASNVATVSITVQRGGGPRGR